MAKKVWTYDPHSGGVNIPDRIKPRIRQRILDHAVKHYSGKFNSIDVKFRGKFCYIDAYLEPFVPEEGYDPDLFGQSREERIEFLRNIPTHLCRLRYFGDDDRWSLGFFTYSHNKYEPCVFDDGGWEGTPEKAFDTSSVYLKE
jgi:hypothetical protein